MSFYNMIFGTNSNADFLLSTLGITRNDVPRFRDCFFEDGKIVIHTRTGGGNREYYESEKSCRDEYPEYFTGTDDPKGPWNVDLRNLEGYERDEDDEYDSTYANFYFQPKNGVETLLKEWGQLDTAIAPKDRWEQLMSDLNGKSESPEAKAALEVGKQLLEKLEIVR